MATTRTKKSARRGARLGAQPPLYVSVPEAARLLGVGKTLAWDLVHDGRLPSIRLGRRVVVSREVVEDLARGRPDE